jgi:iron(III) transport system ATP-binding protein
MIRIENIKLNYPTERGVVQALQGITLSIKEAEFYTLLGPSGCGKTTTLRCVAGLEIPTDGEILISNRLVYSSSRGICVPCYKRNIGMVFQSYAIWPHLTVFENVAFPLREMKERHSESRIREKVHNALSLVQLDGLQDRPAPFLSGGQQQRLALARALVREPPILLLDEPLSNLDAKLREETRFELRQLIKRLGITTLYVTHDQLEALVMSDTVAVMNQGRILQEGSPVEIYQSPSNRFVANFIGEANFIDGEIIFLPANGKQLGEVATSLGHLKCMLPDGETLGERVVIVVRPEDIALSRGSSASDANVIEASLEDVIFMGNTVEYQVKAGDYRLHFNVHPSTGLSRGASVSLLLSPYKCRALNI